LTALNVAERPANEEIEWVGEWGREECFTTF